MKTNLIFTAFLSFLLISTMAFAQKGSKKGEPVVTFAGIEMEGTATKEKLLATSKMDISGDEYTIVGFDLTMLVKTEEKPKGTLTTFSARSSKITSEMVNLIKQAKPGDKLFIENVMGQDARGKKTELSGVKITIE